MRCIYATRSWSVHDRRWMEALDHLGIPSREVRRGELSVDEFLARVREAARDADVVLAGPLDSVTAALKSLEVPLVGLSWGFDIPAMGDLSWLMELDGVVVDSFMNWHALLRAGVNQDRITYLPWGVDLEMFRPYGEALCPFAVPVGARVLLSLRAHEPIYRVGTALDAFSVLSARHPEMHLVIGNRGSQTEMLRKHASELDAADRIHFIGQVDERDLPSLFRACHCYISCSEVDGTSVTMLQAMACGIPVVTSDVGGNRDWIDNGKTGYLFPVGNENAAAQSVSRALHQLDIASAARQLVEAEANWATNIIRLRAALQSAVTRR